MSIPLIVFGSTLILKVMERFPIIITAGAALLGWLAGEMMLTDPAIPRWFAEMPESAVRIAGVVGAVLVVIAGKCCSGAQEAAPETAPARQRVTKAAGTRLRRSPG